MEFEDEPFNGYVEFLVKAYMIKKDKVPYETITAELTLTKASDGFTVKGEFSEPYNNVHSTVAILDINNQNIETTSIFTYSNKIYKVLGGDISAKSNGTPIKFDVKQIQILEWDGYKFEGYEGDYNEITLTITMDIEDTEKYTLPINESVAFVHGDKYIIINKKNESPGELHGVFISDYGRYYKLVDSPFEADDDTRIVYGNGKYVVYNGTEEIWYSSDAINWQPDTLSIPSQIHSLWEPQVKLIKFCDTFNKFIGLTRFNNGTALPICSEDGVNWTECKFDSYKFTNEYYEDIVCSDDYIVAVGQGEYNIIYTSDGENWEAKHQINISGTPHIAYGNGKYVITSAVAVLRTTHPYEWVLGTVYDSIQYVTFTNDKFIIYVKSGSNYLLKSSTDGEMWYNEQIDYDAGPGGSINDILQNPVFKYTIDDITIGDKWVARYNYDSQHMDRWTVYGTMTPINSITRVGDSYYVIGYRSLIYTLEDKSFDPVKCLEY